MKKYMSNNFQDSKKDQMIAIGQLALALFVVPVFLVIALS